MPETVLLGCQHRSWSDAEAGQLSLNRSTSSVLSSTPSPGVVGAAIHPSAIYGIAGLTSSRRRIEVTGSRVRNSMSGTCMLATCM